MNRAGVIPAFNGQHRFLSNFWMQDEMQIFGYPSVEHYYQAKKTQDQDIRQKIKEATDAKAAKFLAQRLIHDIPLRWDRGQREKVMMRALCYKFGHKHPEVLGYYRLGDALLATGSTFLLEGNQWHDNFWGACFCPRCPGSGQNTLGEMLMFIRNVLRQDGLAGWTSERAWRDAMVQDWMELRSAS